MERHSLTLGQVFDKIGVSISVRDKIKQIVEMNDVSNNAQRLIVERVFRLYLMGSYSEGTFRPSLKSDVDLLGIFNDIIVVEGYTPQDQCSLRLFTDKKQAPGYVQIVIEGNKGTLPKLPFPIKLHKGRKLLVNQMKEWFLEELFGYEYHHHGPAVQMKNKDSVESDCVFGFQCDSQCETWQSLAAEWYVRFRPGQWPTSKTIKKLTRLPCFVVPVGIKGSLYEQFEWRLSFNLQEQQLFTNLTDTPYKCFMLLKYIKESFIRPDIGAGFSSYHCKTALLYVLEKNGEELCKPERLLECFLKCIDVLRIWCEQGHCPSYFIPKCNLFRGKLSKCEIDKLKDLFKTIYNRPLDFISRIEYDHIGPLFSGNLSDETRQKFEKNAFQCIAFMIEDMLFDSAIHIYMSLHSVLSFVNLNGCETHTPEMLCDSGLKPEDTKKIVSRYFTALNQISHLYDIHLNNEPKMYTIRYFLLGIETSLACHLAVLALQQPEYRDWIITASAIHFGIAVEGGYKIGMIKLASVTYMMGHLESCKCFLANIGHLFNDKLFYFSGIYFPNQLDEDLVLQKASLECSAQHVITTYFCDHVCFYPGELLITPDGLKFEMFRSEPKLPLRYSREWHPFATIDARTLYRFLCLQTRLVQESLTTFITHELKYKHIKGTIPESKINLLSWLAKCHGDFELSLWLNVLSMYFFKDTITKLRQYNKKVSLKMMTAAKIHFAVSIYKMWNNHNTTGIKN